MATDDGTAMPVHGEVRALTRAGGHMTAPLELLVRIDDAPPDEVAAVTRELGEWIKSTVPQVHASPPAPGVPRPGDKGVEIEVGTLLLAFINAGAATALVNCLMTYIKERRRSVKLEVRGPDGKGVVLDAQNLGRGEMDNLTTRLRDLVQDATAVQR